MKTYYEHNEGSPALDVVEFEPDPDITVVERQLTPEDFAEMAKKAARWHEERA